MCIRDRVYMAQLLGMDRRSECGRVTATLLTATSAVAIVLALICAVFNGPILRLMNTPAEAYDMAVQYLVIGSAGLIFTFMYNGLAAVSYTHLDVYKRQGCHCPYGVL